ncbi:MAG: hypothetical protein ACPLN0_05175 [Candidatus Hydrothermia bacterium]
MLFKKFRFLVGFLFLLLFFNLSCSRAPERPQVSKSAIPVFEVFGYARCPNCPVVEDVVDSLKKIYGDSVVVLEYHLRLLGDTLSPVNIDERRNLYGLPMQAPISVVHGQEIIMGSQDVTFERFNDYYVAIRRGRADSLNLRVEEISIGMDSVIFQITCDTTQFYGSSKLYIFSTRDSIYFAQPGAPDSLFNNVVRYYASYVPRFPILVKVPIWVRSGGNFVILVQDTVTRNIVGVYQRRF